MKSITLLILAISISSFAGGANEPAGASLSAIDRLARIKQDYQEAENAYQAAMQALAKKPKAEQETEEAWKRFDARQAELFLAAVDLAKGNPQSDVGFQALEWTLKSVRVYYLPAGPQGLELMKQHLMIPCSR